MKILTLNVQYWFFFPLESFLIEWTYVYMQETILHGKSHMKFKINFISDLSGFLLILGMAECFKKAGRLCECIFHRLHIHYSYQ